MSSLWFRRSYSVLAVGLVLLGPYFFYCCVDFLRRVDYTAAFFSLLAGWALLRAGVDLSRALLATELSPPLSPPQHTASRAEITDD